jgi:hypothetical protein
VDAPGKYPSHYLKFGEERVIDEVGNVYVVGRGHDANSNYHYLTSKYNKTGRKLWERRHYTPGDYYFSGSMGIAVDRLGNAYITGGTFLREPVPGPNALIGYVTIKYDAAGDQQWVASYDGPTKVLWGPADIAVDSKGSVYVLGGAFEYSDVEPTFDHNTQADRDDEFWDTPDSDLLIIKYDTSGRQLWAVCYGSPANDEDSPSEIAVDNADNIYVVGYTAAKDGRTKFVRVKYDTDGNQLWVSFYAGEKDKRNAPSGLAVDSVGNVYVTGWGTDLDSYTDIVTVKYDAKGEQKWAARYRQPGKKSVSANSILLDHAGNVLVTGYITVLPWQGCPTYEPLRKNADCVTLKYDSNGNEQWVAHYEVPEGDTVWTYDLKVDGQGDIYTIGWVDSDALIIKYDPNGNQKSISRLKTKSELAKFLSTVSRR